MVTGFRVRGAWANPKWRAKPQGGWVVANLKDGRKVPCQGLRGNANTVGKFLDEMNRELATRA